MQREDNHRQAASQPGTQRKIFQAILSGRCVRILGPRYIGKSRLVKEVAHRVRSEYSPYVSYQTLEDYKQDGWSDFFTRLFRNIEKDVLPDAIPAENAQCAIPLDLQKNLYDLMRKCDQNLVIFIDDLEIAPPNLIASLLGVIRALFMVSFSHPGPRFQAAVCGSLSFNQLALPYVSRFESISEMVLVGDLNDVERRTFLDDFCARFMIQQEDEGVQRFFEYTGGDRYLIRHMMDFIQKEMVHSDEPGLTRAIVETAASEFLLHAMELGTGEIIRHIESDPNLLSCVLKVLEQGSVSIRQLPLPTLEIPNMLDLSGVFKQEGQDYQIKCQLWQRLLTERFNPARVGRLYALAGYWQQAIDSLRQVLAAQPDVKLDLFNATINYMHASPNGENAFLNLAYGLEAIYPDIPFRLYQRTASALRQVYPQSKPARELLIGGSLHHEVDALHGPDYSVIFDPASPQILFPLRTRSDTEPLGLLALSQKLNLYPGSSREEEIYQLIGFLRQAARALEARDTYGNMLLDAESRAEKQKNLTKILTRILYGHNLPRETIFRLIMAGVTSGLCLEFNRAILFILDEKRQALVAQIGVGHLTRQDADRDWKNFPFQTLNELIEALLVPDYQYTRLHDKVYGKSIPVKPGATNLFARVLADQEPKVSRRQLSLEGLPQALIEDIGTTESYALIPFKASPYLTGVLYVDNRFTLKEISEERIFLLRGFMNQAALVMELSRSLIEEQRRAVVLTDLLHAEEAINEQITRQITGVFDQIAERARLLFNPNNAVLAILKRQVEAQKTVFITDQMVYKGTSRDAYSENGEKPRSDRGFIRHVIQQGFVHISDIEQDDPSSELEVMRHSTFVKAENVRAMVGIRIGSVDDPDGVLYLNWDTPHLVTREEQALMTIFASFAAVTIPSARRYEQVQADLGYRTREMVGLSQLLHAGTELWSEGEIQKIVRQALSTTTGLTGIASLALIRRSPMSQYKQYSLEPGEILAVRQISQLADEQIARAFTFKSLDNSALELENGLLWPIQVGGNLLAGMVLKTGDKPGLLEKHKEYLDHLCNRLALTFHQAQIYQALTRLFQAALRMTQNIETPDFLDDFMNQLVAEALESLCSVDTITSYYLDKDTLRLKVGPTAGLRDPAGISVLPPDTSSVQNEVLKANQPIFAENVRGNSQLMGTFVERESIVSAAAFPLRVGDNRVGSIFFSYRHYQEFDPGEKALLSLFVQLAAIAVNHTFLQEEAIRRQKRLETVAHITDHLSKAGSDMDNMYRNVFKEVLQAVPNAHNACIIQKDTDLQQYFIVPASLEFYQVQLQPNQDTLRIMRGTPRGIAIRVIEGGQPALIKDVSQDPDYIPAISTSQSEICVPVDLDGRPHAAILLESNYRNAFTEDDQLLLSALAPVISIAIQRVQQMLRQRERAEMEKMKDLSVLLVHEVAHAVANIPDLISEMTESINQGEAVDAECLDDLLHNAEQANQLSVYVRDMSHMSFFDPELQALEPVIETAIEQIKKTVPEHIRLAFQHEQRTISLIFDQKLISILLKNMIENAVRAIPADREGLIEISTGFVSTEVTIQVHDNGTGIPSDNQDMVFERPFSTQEDQTRMHGFGLWLCKEITAIHRGSISFASSPDAGTTFTIRLPLNLPQELV